MTDRTHPRVASVACVHPPYRLDQRQVLDAVRSLAPDTATTTFDRLASVFDTVAVEHRHVSMPPEWFTQDHTFGERNAQYQRTAIELAERAAVEALAAAGVAPGDVGSIVFVSSTGLATPSLDAALVGRLGLAPSTHRQSVFGRGCAGGVVGLGFAADRHRLEPDCAVLLIVVELCSLTYRRRDASPTNIVASALFGDGAAAVVLTADGTGMEVVGHHGSTWPGTGELMGWEFGDDGMTVALQKRVPVFVVAEFRRSLEQACERFDVTAVDHHLVHPGSSRVLDAVTDVLGIGEDALSFSRTVLRDHGNMSAVSVLWILALFEQSGLGSSGDVAVLSAMGPGFSIEHVVARC